jgi:hypothetical protein
MTLTAALDRLRERAESDPSLVETLEHLADADPVEDPFATPADDVAKLARTINRKRQTDRLAELRARSVTTGQVVELVASISDRKGVDRRRARGALLGIRAGNQMLHPAWQFDLRSGDTLPGLSVVLAACPKSRLTDSTLTRSPRRHAPKRTVPAWRTCWPLDASRPRSRSCTSPGISPDPLPRTAASGAAHRRDLTHLVAHRRRTSRPVGLVRVRPSTPPVRPTVGTLPGPLRRQRPARRRTRTVSSQADHLRRVRPVPGPPREAAGGASPDPAGQPRRARPRRPGQHRTPRPAAAWQW